MIRRMDIPIDYNYYLYDGYWVIRLKKDTYTSIWEAIYKIKIV